jgi:hypothetical protein
MPSPLMHEASKRLVQNAVQQTRAAVFRTEAGKMNAQVQLPARCGNRRRKELSRARFKSNRLDFFAGKSPSATTVEGLFSFRVPA